jgi:hypothetical protein
MDFFALSRVVLFGVLSMVCEGLVLTSYTNLSDLWYGLDICTSERGNVALDCSPI